LLILARPEKIFAQAMSERWVCLEAKSCNKDACGPGYNGHQALLTAKADAMPLANKDTYIVECLSTDDGQMCTTGFTVSDMDVYKQDNLRLLQDKVGYNFHGLSEYISNKQRSNPIKSDGSGNIGQLIWGDSTPKGHMRKWMALNYWTPTQEGVSGAAGALQQGTVDFDFATAEKDCVSIGWDPYGRVFYSDILEPIKGASVTLMMKKPYGSFKVVTPGDVMGGNIINPQTTVEDGVFSFVVPDGTYKLSVSGTGYTFPVSDVSTIHQNYFKAYFDIYPASTGEEIIQAGSIQHRDIPVAAVGTSISSPPKLMDYFYEVHANEKSCVVEGAASHPLTKIIAYSVKPSGTNPSTTVRYRQVGEIQADKLGKFKLVVDQSDFEPDESFGEVDLSKVDLTLLTQQKKGLFRRVLAFFTQFIKVTEAQTSAVATLKFNPIPTYLEGYAYDAAGNVIPNATVGVYLNFSNKAYYQTKSDEKGYYKITSENLPTMAYEIRYTNPNGIITKTTTTQFIAQNTKYLTDNKISLNVYKDQQGKVMTKKDMVANKTSSGFFQSNAGKNGLSETKVENNTQNSMFMIIGILIFLILAVGAILAVYLIKKKNTQQSYY